MSSFGYLFTFYSNSYHQLTTMSEDMLAYCGLNCTECPAYKVKQTGDEKLLAETVEKWNSPEYPVTAEDIPCDGCKTASGEHFKFCATCPVRNCAGKRGVMTCAHCDDYGCDIMEGFLSKAGDDLRKRLAAIRDSL